MLFYFIYFSVSPLFFLIIFIAKFFNHKIYRHEKNINITINNVQLLLASIDRKVKKILLFHAASAGEFEQLKPILNKINRDQYFIIQSFTSPIIYEQEYQSKLFDVCCYHPYDFFWESKSFFTKINPDAYIITRHDIWPFHLLVANKLKAKVFYVNANLHNNSMWTQWYMKYVSQTIFKNITLCCIPSESIFENAKHIIKKEKILITGDSRFNQILERFEENKDTQYLPDYFSYTQNIIFGSYDVNDEPIIIQSLLRCFPKGEQSLIEKKQRIILVPHEADNKTINGMINKLRKLSFNINKYTALSENNNQSNIIIVDKVGILADIYKYAQLAYVGAGFGRGVHSVIEPVVHGCITSFGPNIELLDEAKYAFRKQLCYMISNINDMCKFIKLDINNNKNVIMRDKMQEYILNNKNASRKILDNILQSL